MVGGVNGGEVAIWDEDRRTWGNGGCVGDTWVVVGDLGCGLRDSCHQGRRRGNGRMLRGRYTVDGMSEGLGERNGRSPAFHQEEAAR